MNTFKVTIMANVTKSFMVQAADEDEASQIAHELFNVRATDEPEKYHQDTVAIEPATKKGAK